MSFLAIDVGGTSTRAVVVDADGTCTGYATAGSGNPTASGATEASAAIMAAAKEAMASAGVGIADIEAAAAGIAGANGPAGIALHRSLLAAGLDADLAVVGDVLATYHSGTLAPDGYALIAGTGAVAGRVQDFQIAATADGLGWLLGDAGSGFWLGRRVVREVAGVLDGRLGETALVGLVLAELGIDPTADRDNGRPVALQKVLDAVYQSPPVTLARFARLAFEASAGGDETARRLVADAADELAVTAAAVVSPDVNGPFVLGGSILSQQPSVATRVVEAIRQAGCDGPISTVPDGTIGAAVLALRRGGVTLDEATFDRMATSLAALRQQQGP